MQIPELTYENVGRGIGLFAAAGITALTFLSTPGSAVLGLTVLSTIAPIAFLGLFVFGIVAAAKLLISQKTNSLARLLFAVAAINLGASSGAEPLTVATFAVKAPVAKAMFSLYGGAVLGRMVGKALRSLVKGRSVSPEPTI